MNNNIAQLGAPAIELQTVAVQAGKPDADPFDLLCHLAFKPRVPKPLQRFIEALFTTKAACRVVTGDNETKLNQHQVEEAYARVASAKEPEEIIDLPGVFGRVPTLSLEFEFRPDHGDLIRGPLDDEITEQTATEWALHLIPVIFGVLRQMWLDFPERSYVHKANYTQEHPRFPRSQL